MKKLQNPIRTARMARLMAKIIDLFMMVLVSLLFYPLGPLLALIYACLADSLQNGQSVGKRFAGIRTIDQETGLPCSFKQSTVRNLPVAIPLILALIPFWGWVLAPVFAAVSLSIETYLILTLDSGQRLGDAMANTTVVATIDAPEKAPLLETFVGKEVLKE